MCIVDEIQRNQPCPCGSGKKYKKCCLRTHEQPKIEVAKLEDDNQVFSRALRRSTAWLEETDLYGSDPRWIDDLLGSEDSARLFDELNEHGEFHQLSLVGMCVDRVLCGEMVEEEGSTRAVGDYLLGHRRNRKWPRPPLFDVRERRWMEALLRSPLRLYQVVEVIFDEGVVLEDGLSGERVRVREKTGSQTLEPGILIAARVVEGRQDQPRLSMLWAFSLLAFEDAITRIRKAEHQGASQQGLEDLIREGWMRTYLYKMPELVDMSTQEPILLVTAHYVVNDWDALSSALSADLAWDGNKEDGWVLLESPSEDVRRVLASVNPSEKHQDRVEVFCRTMELSEEGRRRFEMCAGDSVKFLIEELVDPAALLGRRLPRASRAMEEGGPSREFMQDFYEQTYGDFLDDPVPVLGDRTPREAAETEQGRTQVEDLIRSYERSEMCMAKSQNREPASLAFLWEGLARNS